MIFSRGMNPENLPEIEVMNTTFLNTDFNGSNISVQLDYYGPLQTYVFGIWLGLIIALSVIGNLLVIIVILVVRGMHSAENGTNMFLLSLAIADLMVGILVAPVSLNTLIHEKWDFGSFICTVNSFLNTLFLVTSIYLLMFISIHKYMTVKRLSQCDTSPVSKCLCRILICASWLYGVFFGFLTTTILSKAEYKTKTTQCGPKYPELHLKSTTLSVINLILNFIIPFVIMLVMYIHIYLVMRKSGLFRRQSTIRSSSTEGRRTSGEKGAINTLVIVLTCFIVCWIPYVCYTNFVFFTKDRDTIPAFLNPLAYCFGFTNSACNPIIYAFRFPDFRKGYVKIFNKLSFRTRREKNVFNLENVNYRRETVDLVYQRTSEIPMLS